VLRLVRPDGTSRTWWMNRPDENALNDTALELVLPEAAELGEITPALLTPKRLPELWPGEEITVKSATDYFAGGKTVQVDRGGYREPMSIPKVSRGVLEKAITAAVENGLLWMRSGPASLFGEPIPAGILTANAKLYPPPAVIAAAEVLPENLPDAWKDNTASGLSLSTMLSFKVGTTLPWKTIKDAIHAALQGRFLKIAEDSATWPCDFPAAQLAKFRVLTGPSGGFYDGDSGGEKVPSPKMLVAIAEFGPSEIQDLGDIIPDLLKLKAKSNTPFRFQIRIEMGDGKVMPSADAAKEANVLLKGVKEGWQLS